MKLPATILLSLLTLTLGSCRPKIVANDVYDATDEASDPDAKVNFQYVKSLIETRDVRTIDELLPLLPTTFRANYVLLRESESVQEGSVHAPRVLMSTANSSFVMAFNGDASQSGYFDIETYEFDETTGAFTFREIGFPEPGDTDGVHFTGDNPAECRSCHRNPPRPIFPSWPNWPQAYFSVDGASGQTLPRQDALDFATFKASAASHPRYRHLVDLTSYDTPERVQRGDRANSFNATLLGQIDRMVDLEIRKHPRYERYKYAFDAAIAGCADIPSFLPRTETADFARTYASIRQETLAKNAKASATVIALRWLFENNGMKTVHWSPTNVPRYAFVRDAGGDGLRLTRRFPDMSCEKLKVASLAGS